MSILCEELHELIDRLPESQVAPILAVVRASSSAEGGGEEWPLPDFVGALSSGKGDLAARSSVVRLVSVTLTPAELAERQACGRAAMAAKGVVIDDDPTNPDRLAAERFWAAQ
jgi:hypothetical protein